MTKQIKGRFLLASLLLGVICMVVFGPVGRGVVYQKNKNSNYRHPPIPIAKESLDIEAEAMIVIDVATNTILAEKNKDKRIFPASITKLVTAITALNIYTLEEKLKVNEYKIGKTMELVSGDELTVADLVRGIIVYSANDAAYNLANNHPRGTTGFVEEMNKVVIRYGLKNTHLTNFDGTHQSSHYSSAYDLAQIGRLAIKNQTIKDTARLIDLEVTGSMGKVYRLTTTNELLGRVDEIKGLKTGWTPEAGGCFLALIEKDNKQILAVIINSLDRFGETKKIVNWVNDFVGWRNYYWEM